MTSSGNKKRQNEEGTLHLTGGELSVREGELGADCSVAEATVSSHFHPAPAKVSLPTFDNSTWNRKPPRVEQLHWADTLPTKSYSNAAPCHARESNGIRGKYPGGGLFDLEAALLLFRRLIPLGLPPRRPVPPVDRSTSTLDPCNSVKTEK